MNQETDNLNEMLSPDYEFSGQYRYSIDSKGRVSVPVNFRKLDDGREIDHFKLTQGFDGCLFMYPIEYWREVVAGVKRLPVTNRAARNLQRQLIGKAVDCRPDKQGRITIPPGLREIKGAEFTNDAIIMGVTSRIEIWPAEVYEEFDSNHEKDKEENISEFNVQL